MRVLLGVDLRIDGHGWLLRQAAVVAKRLDARIDLMFASGGRGNASTHMKQLQAHLLTIPEPQRGSAHVASGTAADELIAHTEHYDLLVVGPREPGALERWLHGPMATRVFPHARCPVLVPRTDVADNGDYRVLVGVSPSHPGAPKLLSQAATWAANFGGRLDAIHILAPLTTRPMPAGPIKDQLQHEREALRREAMNKVSTLLQAVPSSVRGVAQADLGDPGDVLVNRSSAYDLLVVGTAEKTGLARVVLGSVARKTVRNAQCPVLTLPHHIPQT